MRRADVNRSRPDIDPTVRGEDWTQVNRINVKEVFMKDQVRGKAEEIKGKVTGNRGEETKGKARQTVGKVKRTVRDVKEDLR